jgi:hypothetical protein
VVERNLPEPQLVKSRSAGRSGICGGAGSSPIIMTVSGRFDSAISGPAAELSGVPVVAAAGGMITRRLRSTASSSGSRIHAVSPASRTDAGSSSGCTAIVGLASDSLT